MKKTKILVTGAGGFVGRNLVPKLIEEGFEVLALDRKKVSYGRNSKKVKVIIEDLASPKNLKNRIKGVEIVVHLAAQISSKNPEDFDRNNVEATKNLLNALKSSKAREIILFSSAAVTSIRKDKYAETKTVQEELVRKSGKDYRIIRPSMMYGPFDDKNIGWLIRMIKKYPVIPLPGGGNFGRQPVYIEDICQIVVQMVSSPHKKKIYEIHGKEYVTMKEMIKVITKNIRSPRLAIPVPEGLLFWSFFIGERVLKNPKFTSDQIESLLSGEKFKGEAWWKTFGIIPTNFEVGVSKMMKK